MSKSISVLQDFDYGQNLKVPKLALKFQVDSKRKITLNSKKRHSFKQFMLSWHNRAGPLRRVIIKIIVITSGTFRMEYK